MTKRIQRKRQKGWRMPNGAVYIGRPSKWGNPYKTAYAYEHWLKGDLEEFREYQERRAWILEHVHELRGKVLACWCRPDRECHGDVLARMAETAHICAENKLNARRA